MSAIFKREMRAYFTSPIGYIQMAISFLFSGFYFYVYYGYGYPGSEYITLNAAPILMLIVPINTMRLMSEDKRQKIDQALLTAPVNIGEIIMGKFFAALTMLFICNSMLIVYHIIFSCYVTLNWLIFLNCFVSLMLLCAALVAMGMFISSLTESTAISFILSLFACLLVMFFSQLVGMIGVDWLTKTAEFFDFYERFSATATGVLNLADVVFFVSFTAIFLFLSMRSLEKKRWA
ncbi:MAG: ABC transporter permease [Clostridia bacterium]|nr:ABC transporter permease [Clostridia bacterium]